MLYPGSTVVITGSIITPDDDDDDISNESECTWTHLLHALSSDALFHVRAPAAQ